MRKALLAIALMGASVPAFAEKPDSSTWLTIGETDDSTVYARIDDLLKGNPTGRDVRVWMHVEAGKTSKVNWTHQIALQSVNCVERTYRVLQLTTYYRSGKTSTQGRFPEAEYIIPDSVMDGAADILCMTGIK